MTEPLACDDVVEVQCPACQKLWQVIHELRVENLRLTASNRAIWQMAQAFQRAAKRRPRT